MNVVYNGRSVTHMMGPETSFGKCMVFGWSDNLGSTVFDYIVEDISIQVKNDDQDLELN